MDAGEPKGAAASVRLLRTKSEQKLCDPTGLPNTCTPSWVRGRPSGSASPPSGVEDHADDFLRLQDRDFRVLCCYAPEVLLGIPKP
ncbi:unnamed protein product [Closterium sp. NIES-54]